MVTITEPHPRRAPRLWSGKAGMGKRWTRGQSGRREKNTVVFIMTLLAVSCLQHTQKLTCNKALSAVLSLLTLHINQVSGFHETQKANIFLMIWFGSSLLLHVAAFPFVVPSPLFLSPFFIFIFCYHFTTNSRNWFLLLIRTFLVRTNNKPCNWFNKQQSEVLVKCCTNIN